MISVHCILDGKSQLERADFNYHVVKQKNIAFFELCVLKKSVVLKFVIIFSLMSTSTSTASLSRQDVREIVEDTLFSNNDKIKQIASSFW